MEGRLMRRRRNPNSQDQSLMSVAIMLISYGAGLIQAGRIKEGAVPIVLGMALIFLKYHYKIPNNRRR